MNSFRWTLNSLGGLVCTRQYAPVELYIRRPLVRCLDVGDDCTAGPKMPQRFPSAAALPTTPPQPQVTHCGVDLPRDMVGNLG